MQEYTSKETSINSTKVPVLFTKIFKGQGSEGDANLDYGGGKFDTATNYLNSLGIENFIYDPYNRPESVKELEKYKFKGHFNSCTLSNVLNVIKEEEVRLKILREISHFYLKRGCPLYITVYEGDKTGVGKETKKGCWQNNKKLSSYVKEVSIFFNFVTIKKGVITAWNRI